MNELGVLFSGEMGINAEKQCPEIYYDIDYMTCPSSGDKQLPASINCCLTDGSEGCTLHLKNGSKVYCRLDGFM
jgi:Potato type II proteinase inhibitor family